ncbi:MAG: hypothetical protein PWP31_598 [Clostridia bacterium]|nr:hypothetical protein [Clostridia bacterium]
MIPVTAQWQIFIALIGLGIILAFVFDCYRVGRYFFRPTSIGTQIGDIIFSIFLTIITFILLMFINWGDVRAYVFLAIGFGLIFYMFFLGNFLRKGLYAGGRVGIKVIRFSKLVFNKTFFIIFLPGRFILSWFSWVFAPFKAIWHRMRPPGGPPPGTTE